MRKKEYPKVILIPYYDLKKRQKRKGKASSSHILKHIALEGKRRNKFIYHKKWFMLLGMCLGVM